MKEVVKDGEKGGEMRQSGCKRCREVRSCVACCCGGEAKYPPTHDTVSKQNCGPTRSIKRMALAGGT